MSIAEPGSCEMNDAEVEGLFLDGSSMSPRRDNFHEVGGAVNEVLNEELISSHKMEVQTKSKTVSDSRSTRLQHFMGNAHTLSPICGNSGVNPRPLFRTSSPRVTRKETEDGIVEVSSNYMHCLLHTFVELGMCLYCQLEGWQTCHIVMSYVMKEVMNSQL
jgi:hypothetical protein